MAIFAFLLSAIATLYVVPALAVGGFPSPLNQFPVPLRETTITRKYWTKWSGVERIFAFGDSYTSNGFDLNGPSPNASNPIGNPPYPGDCSSAGENWLGYLTTRYNRSFIQTYDIAFGGATVDKELVPCYLPMVADFKQQVNDMFVPHIVDRKEADWSSSNSLFVMWFGINDVNTSYQQKSKTLYTKIMKVYEELLVKLYASGARNFLLLNVPPINLAPTAISRGRTQQALEAFWIADFNARLSALVTKFHALYVDTTVFLFDTNSLFVEVLEDPTTHEQTAMLKNTTGFCTAYQMRLGGEDEDDDDDDDDDGFRKECEFKMGEYFWLNDLHPTWRIHGAIGEEVGKMLKGDDGET